MRNILTALIIVFTLSQSSVIAQTEKLTLQQCVDVALKNNPQVKQGGLQVEFNQNTLEQSRYQKYPNANFSASQGFNSGRSVDPFTNGFVEKGVSFSNFGLNSGVTLFNGFQLKNTIIQNQINVQATQKDFEATKNNISLNVALAYLNILNTQDLLEAARKQVDITNQQLTRTGKLVAAGTLPVTNSYDLKAQVANDELAVVNAQVNLDVAKLTLKQLMNVPANQDIDVVRIAVADPTLQPYDATLEQIYETALKYLPEVAAAKLRIESAKTGIAIAKGTKMPTIGFNAGVNSAVSSAAPSERFVSDGGLARTIEVPSATRFVQVGTTSVPLIERVTIPSGSLQNFGYFNQLDFNRNIQLGLNLRMPIFNGYQVRYRVANARIQQKNTEYQSEIVTNQLRQNIEQAFNNMTNASKRYQATTRQVEALEQAFRASEIRFNVGALNSVDYNLAKTNLDRARINQILFKYEYIFRMKVLDFYQNKPLSF